MRREGRGVVCICAKAVSEKCGKSVNFIDSKVVVDIRSGRLTKKSARAANE